MRSAAFALMVFFLAGCGSAPHSAVDAGRVCFPGEAALCPRTVASGSFVRPAAAVEMAAPVLIASNVKA